MSKRPKFKINDHVKLTPIAKLLLKAGPFKDCSSEGDFVVLGDQQRVDLKFPPYYLIENIENPHHPTLWVPELWLERRSKWFSRKEHQ